jgi:energy-coupling factor transporter ATP-binding protein EcfA2
MKRVQSNEDPINIIFDKDRPKGMYIADFDYKQTTPRVTIGSTWVGEDIRYNRRYLFRVVDMGYHTNYSQDDIVKSVREEPTKLFRDRDLEFYCREKAWLRLEGEFCGLELVEVFDQPTVLRTMLKPTSSHDDYIIAAPDMRKGFPIGTLRSGNRELEPMVTLEDRFMGFRTLICGASGFGKSTLVRNIARYWLENTNYGVLIDDLKGEYVRDIQNERAETVKGLANHPDAKKTLVLLTPFPRKYQGDGSLNGVTVLPLRIHIDDIPPDSLREVATHIQPAQQQFLDMYGEKKGLFSLLLRRNEDGSQKTDDWYEHFKQFIIVQKAAQNKVKNQDYVTDLADFQQSSYIPIQNVSKHLNRLINMPFVISEGESCLQRVRNYLAQGATIILDKNGLTDAQKVIVSTVLANDLYKHNETWSAGTPDEQKKVIPFVYLVEEAHNLLSKEKASEGSVFVNFAKTGRSFSIGLVAVTQRPSSVDMNILSQFDNYITFRLTNDQDVRDLVKAKSDFNGYDEEIRTMRRGMAVTAFGEPTKVQSIMGFAWTSQRAKSRVSDVETKELEKQRSEIMSKADMP